MEIMSCLAILLSTVAGAVPPLTNGLEVRGQIQIAPGTYAVTTPIRIVENGSTLDLTGVVLSGSRADGPADSYADTALVVDGFSHVIIRNANLRGFKVGIYARACTSLVITGCEVGGNYRQRLFSTPERENEADWLWPHHNDENEWLTNYGAGIYLDGCSRADVSGNSGRDGQNGIVISRTDSSFVYDNDMSYMSGWGLAMWRSNGNEISNNRFDYCVRGYSHGVYRRGQDSAGILVFEQCADNIFALNSATHGGDGFFLYAGHETLERTGTGGSNRNLVYRNDFSHAVANGIEATFSEGNRFIENIIDECQYGVWAGYSYGTDIVGNTISQCQGAGIAIEHGHDNWIEGNTLEGNRVGVALWALPNAHFDSLPFGQRQNTRSERYHIIRNRFTADTTSIRVHNTTEVLIEDNEFTPIDAALSLRSVCPLLRFRCNNIRGGRLLVKNEGDEGVTLDANHSVVWAVEGEVVILDTIPEPLPPDSSDLHRSVAVPSLRGTVTAALPGDAPRGRETILIGDYGPLMVATPQLFPREVSGWGKASVFIEGPPEYFAVGLVAGPMRVEPLTGRSPATIVLRPMRRGFSASTIQINCGERVFDVRAGLASSEWIIRFFPWEGSSSPESAEDWEAIIGATPLDTLHVDAVDFWWGGEAPTERVPAERFATVGETSLNLPAGTYQAHVISDDGVRLFVDDRSVIDNWTPHFVNEEYSSFTVATGLHGFRIEHFQTEGSSWLQLWIDQ